MIGQTLSHYRIIAALGAGGMGEVYRATDTTLGRDVAIKVLPDEFGRDAERLARFEREAKVLASLNHPNIAAIYGLEEVDGKRFLVLELVEGQTLAERLHKGPLPVREALEVCRQVAKGLEAAHEKGIIHRDLKPANVKVTPEGKVKVLDFGLAKATDADEGSGSEAPLSQSPTLAHSGTRTGVILGTVGYMSPEQARAGRVDKRTDVWSFGVILFELLTGTRAFAGETVTDVLAAVVSKEPPWDRLPPYVSPSIWRVLRRCLAKSADERLHDIADARIELDEALRAPGDASGDVSVPAGRETSRRAGLRRSLAWLSLAAAVGLAGLGIGVEWSRHRGTIPVGSEPVLRLSVNGLGWTDAETIDVALLQNLLAISPDGSRLAYSANRDGTRRIYLRALDSFEAQPVKGTENGYGPFFSPDGASLGFAADGRLKRVSLSGGLPQAFARVPNLRGSAWSSDGTVVFNPQDGVGLSRVPAGGGDAKLLLPLDSGAGEVACFLPRFLPGETSLLFTSWLGGKASRVCAYSIATRQRRNVLEDANNAFYLAPGYLVYGRGSAIWAVGFDAARAETVGEPRKMVDGVWVGGFYGTTLFALSANGVLAYAPAGAHAGRRSLVWVDREGHETAITRDERAYAAPRLSPDGKSILIRMAEDTTDIWSYEIARGVLTRLTSEGYAEGPTWGPDGKTFLYSSNKSGVPNIYRQPVGSEKEAVTLAKSEVAEYPEAISPDGKLVAGIAMNPKTGLDIFFFPLDRKAPPTPWLATENSEYSPDFSPDGRWIVYVSRAAGRGEIYVRSVTPGGEPIRVSLHGGTEPRWSRTGREIFYRESQKMMAAEIHTEPRLQVSEPRVLFEGPYEVMDGPVNYDVTPDGKRFLMVKMAPQEAPSELRVVTGWGGELQRALPTGR